ncbi:Vms1/Ankzf1 family peptidyl-tRNA hydrolase [Paenarthrobacter sp. JL.01a]|uniref:Vms1/Ankzf1 family peptidyl-tRNA hydrolase n=1 Tax=Paenarthrobacter sp. JL.01a TaxID=2979324 RepID=UPI0021C77640|nr:Vms1/Ankzf1 family peptidyl-tRNA hydrolase [Paenarthrobacter sp. JL.01a]UXM89989.1 Vms1/Ankzf1 family peptidyl-tRNA hydrolase [Paenarthrobacter sp. JL.01a]
MQRPASAPRRPGGRRTALVPAQRLHGWVERFAASHGTVAQDLDDDGLLVRAADGAEALLRAPWPADGRPGRGATELDRLASLASQERALGVLLVRKGGYALAAASGPRIQTTKSGSRFIDARTTAEHAARIFANHRIEYLVTGGDRALVDQVLAQPSLKAVSGRTRLPFLDVQVPKSAVLAKAAADACSIRISVTDPPV